MKTKEEKLVNKMVGILEEVSDLNGEDIDDSNYRKIYENAAMQLNLYDGDDEDGESDIYQFTYDMLNDYIDLKRELKKILEAQGMDLEQRKAYYKANLVLEA